MSMVFLITCQHVSQCPKKAVAIALHFQLLSSLFGQELVHITCGICNENTHNEKLLLSKHLISFALPVFLSVSSVSDVEMWCCSSDWRADCVALFIRIGNKHFLMIQHFFFFPGPPYFFMSEQYTHEPQSSRLQFEHSPHLLALFL